jgi:hypothetical protein
LPIQKFLVKEYKLLKYFYNKLWRASSVIKPGIMHTKQSMEQKLGYGLKFTVKFSSPLEFFQSVPGKNWCTGRALEEQ